MSELAQVLSVLQGTMAPADVERSIYQGYYNEAYQLYLNNYRVIDGLITEVDEIWKRKVR